MVQIPTSTILNYWLLDLGHEKWFQSSPETDRDICSRFSTAYEKARKIATRRLEDMDLQTGNDYLAAIILFDQFPRNMFRGLAQSFETDPLARRLSHMAIELGFDIAAPLDRRIFFYLPFEHGEEMENQNLAVSLVRERCAESNYLEYAELHRDIIARFGRFPHRNVILGRTSTPQELDYLANGGKTFGAVPPAGK